jgi:hypothetical protein
VKCHCHRPRPAMALIQLNVISNNEKIKALIIVK